MMHLKRASLAAFVAMAVMAACGDSDVGTTEPQPQDDRHAFTYTVPATAPAITSISVAGSLNNWDANALKMTKLSNGSWEAKIKLAPGTYQYKYVFNGDTWAQDMCSDATWGNSANGGKVDPKVSECIDDGFGGRNAVLVVK